MYEIKIHSQDKILELRFWDEVAVAGGTAAREEAATIVREKGLERLLVDLLQAEVLGTTMELYEFVQSDLEVWPLGIRYAFVSQPMNWDPDDVTFSENVAVNRGLDRKSFTSRDEAIDWLIQSEDSK